MSAKDILPFSTANVKLTTNEAPTSTSFKSKRPNPSFFRVPELSLSSSAILFSPSTRSMKEAFPTTLMLWTNASSSVNSSDTRDVKDDLS